VGWKVNFTLLCKIYTRGGKEEAQGRLKTMAIKATGIKWSCFSMAYRYQFGVISSRVRIPSKVEDGMLYSHGTGLLEVRNKTIKDEATFVHKKGYLDAPCL
jgi:hypothetical protein